MSLDVYLKNIKEKCPTCGGDPSEFYSANITHNLGRMADAAGIYWALWRPDEINITKAKELIPLLEEGLKKLKSYPAEYEKYNAPNGWGMYEHFVLFVENYLNACKEYPDPIISVSI